MGLPSTEEIKTQTEKAVRFVDWLADLLRHKNWVTLLLFLDVILIAAFNPLFFSSAVTFVFHRELPRLYPLYFWLVVGLVFTVAVILTVRAVPQKTDIPPSDLTRRAALKFLRPFGFDDAELFVRLRRDQSLQECLGAIMDRDFRFGILCGESGCGKSSFLQAGLWPVLQAHKGHRCVYVKFSDFDPLGAVRQALTEQMQLPKAKREYADLETLLAALPESESRITVLLLDQFEQFFIHRRLKEDRIPFVQSLAAWYKGAAPPLLKILVCIRGDFTDRLIELQKAMRYSLGPNNYFLLEKFTPAEAVDIFRVIAESEKLVLDESFVKEMAENELASRKDGLVSPVDIQILSWMISGQKSADERAFNRTAYQKFGGVEGLLERFLTRALTTRVTEEQRQGALKVLIGLTDSERNLRAGLLTASELEKKLAGSMTAHDINEAIAWLSRSDVRLVTPGKRNGHDCYELAHDRLVPAISRLAGKQLSLADHANQLLDRRVNEWLGNNGASRYLLSWRELRLVQQQLPYLFWGHQKSQKEALLGRSKQRWRWRAATFSVAALLLICFLVWMYSPRGQIWQVRHELVTMSGRIRDKDVHAEAVKALAMVGSFGDALEVAEQIPDPSQKKEALSKIVNISAARAKIARDPALLIQASRAADRMEKGPDRDSALGDIFDVAVETAQATKNDAFLLLAYPLAQILPDKPGALFRIAQASATLGKTEEASTFLKQALRGMEDLKEDSNFRKALRLRELAWEAAETAQATKDPMWWQQALQIAESIAAPHIKAWALSQMAEFADKLGKTQESSMLLQEARQMATGVGSSEDKAWALTRVSEAAATLKETRMAFGLLEDARVVALSIADHKVKSERMSAISETAIGVVATAKDPAFLQQAIDMAQKTGNADKTVLISTAETALYVGDPGKAAELLDRARKEETGESASQAGTTLSEIARVTAELGKATRNPRFWEEARETAEGIQDVGSKAGAFSEIATVAVEAGETDKACAFLKEGLGVVNQAQNSFTTVEHLKNLTRGAATISEPQKAFALLEEALRVAERFKDSFDKSTALSAVAQGTEAVREPQQGLAFLEQIVQVASRMEDPNGQSRVFAAIARAASKLGSVRQARRSVELIGTDLGRAMALVGILQGYAERNEPALAELN